ncbi:MAG TPA: beta/gamma crystallin family protein [Burkholderiaceae bacterium]
MTTRLLKTSLAAAALACCGAAMADVTFYEYDNYGGRSFTVHDPIESFQRIGFNDRASSVVVTGRPWEVCDDSGFHGHCYILRPGNYPSLSSMGLGERISSARWVDRNGNFPPDRWAPPPLPGQVTLYERDNFRGPSFSTTSDIDNLRDVGFNDRASSLVVVGDRWEACDDRGYSGHCVFLRPGNYPNLDAMGMGNSISSVRLTPADQPVADAGWAPVPPPAYDARRRPQEQLFQAQVLATRAVYGTPTQRCWVEQAEVRDDRNRVGGTVIGGILGGILGHQVARGHGAVAAGAIGGALVGSAIGGANSGTRLEDVQRCTTDESGPPQFWDTVYTFNGVEHHVQTTAPAGATITVNQYGEPRI